MSGDSVCAVSSVKMSQVGILQNTVDQTRQVKTIPRNSPRHSYDGLGHCESSIKEAEKPTCVFISHACRTDYKCDSNRQVVWTNTPCTANTVEQTSLTMWMSNVCHGEVTRFAVWSWFRNTFKQKDWEVNTRIDTSVDSQKYIMNQALNEHRGTPFCTRYAEDAGTHCRTRLDIIWAKELAEADTASHTVDGILSSPGVREIEALKSTRTTGQTAAMDNITSNDRTGYKETCTESSCCKIWRGIMSAGRGSVQTRNVSLDSRTTTTAAKQKKQ